MIHSQAFRYTYLQVQDPDNTTQTIYDSWVGSSNSGVVSEDTRLDYKTIFVLCLTDLYAWYVKIGRLGDLTSDYAAFVQHVGVPASDMCFGGGKSLNQPQT